MKNKRVIFGSSVEYYDPSMGLKEWDRPTIEFDIEDGEDFLENLHKAKAIIKEFYKGNVGSQITVNPEYAHLLSQGQLKITPVEKPLGVTVEDITSCPDQKILETYKFLVKGKPELEKAYLDKLTEFLQQKTELKR